MEVHRHHSKDLAAHTFQFDGTPNDRGIASEALFPKGMTQDDIVVSVGRIFTGVEGPPQLGMRSQNRQQFGGHGRPSQADRFAKAREIKFVALGICGNVHRVDLLPHRSKRSLRITSGHGD